VTGPRGRIVADSIILDEIRVTAAGTHSGGG